jgi:ABC-2 type transport system ATP-binding protein
MSSFIEVKNLKKEFGHIKALNGVDLEIQEGEVFGILGPNGAGKTTLVRILSTLLKPSSGKVSVAGVTLPSEDYKLKKLLGYMPQIPSLYEDLPARKNLEFFSSLHLYNGHRENIQDKIEEILEFVELKDRQNDLISTFSSGMKQRLSLACALIHQPKILLLDEPTAGVEPRLKRVFWDYFRRLKQEGTTIIITTHQLTDAENCDRLALMKSGRVILVDTPLRLKSLGTSRIRITQKSGVKELELTNFPEELPKHLKELNGDVLRLEIDSETLEDIFLKLTQTKD